MKLDPKIGRSLKKASPTILTCIGAAGVVATAVLAVKATPKADSLIKADSRRNHDGDPYAATKLEAVKSCWKCYIPAAATGVATIICIFGANTLNKKQQASLASAYALVNRSYSDYKHTLKELYGEDAHKKIMESIAAEKSSMPPITAMKQPCKSCQTAITLLPSRTSRSFPAIGMRNRCPSTASTPICTKTERTTQAGRMSWQTSRCNMTRAGSGILTRWKPALKAIKRRKTLSRKPSVNASLRRMPQSGSKV